MSKATIARHVAEHGWVCLGVTLPEGGGSAPAIVVTKQPTQSSTYKDHDPTKRHSDNLTVTNRKLNTRLG